MIFYLPANITLSSLVKKIKIEKYELGKNLEIVNNRIQGLSLLDDPQELEQNLTLKQIQ